MEINLEMNEIITQAQIISRNLVNSGFENVYNLFQYIALQFWLIKKMETKRKRIKFLGLYQPRNLPGLSLRALAQTDPLSGPPDEAFLRDLFRRCKSLHRHSTLLWRATGPKSNYQWKLKDLSSNDENIPQGRTLKAVQ